MTQITWSITFVLWVIIGTVQITCSIVSKSYTVSLWKYISCWMALMVMLSITLAAIMQS